MFDKNKDGVIDRQEFVEMVNSHPDVLLVAVRSMLDVFVRAVRTRPLATAKVGKVVPVLSDASGRPTPV